MPKQNTSKKTYNYEKSDLQDLHDLKAYENIQHALTDDVVLDYLNRIAKSANLLTEINYQEINKADELSTVLITFKMVKEYPKNAS